MRKTKDFSTNFLKILDSRAKKKRKIKIKTKIPKVSLLKERNKLHKL